MSSNIKIEFALTGSFCTFEKTVALMKLMKEKGIDILPFMSFNAYNLDTKFGKACDFIKRIESICEKKIISDIVSAEPIGPQKLADIMLVLPCTGNTLAKLRNGIYDTPVTLAVKSHLRNERPVVIGISTNDALSNTAKNIGELLNYRNLFFVPFGQDDCINKPRSIVCDFDKAYETVIAASEGRQLQPMLI